ncbi:MAG: ribbon-helix-helix protein, CopG family [Spirochaetes bacterium]|nr:ribbon-helix-helix protein, CopG family [Spirochaetota bacterium]
MRKVLTISIPENIEKEIDQFVKEENSSRSEVIRKAIMDYIYFKKLRKLREKMMLKAQSKKAYTDEDIFKTVS